MKKQKAKHQNQKISIVAATALVLLLSACNSKTMKGSPPSAAPGSFKDQQTISFADVHDRVLGPVCSRCHAEFDKYADLMTPDHVVPGNSAQSGIFFRLKNNPGGDMPSKAPMIPDADAALIRDWIDQGAPEFIAQGPGGQPAPAPVPKPKPQPTPAPGPAPAPKPQPGPPSAPVTFAEVKNRILDPKCSKCHGAGSQRGDLTTYLTVMSYVKPNDFAGSSLIKNLQNFGGNMPKKSGPLTQDEVDLLKNWIDSGAPEAGPKTPATPTAPASKITFNDVQTKVFAAKCVMCHSDSKLTAGFSLENYDSIVVNARLVNLAKPDDSGLYQSVIDDFMPPKKMVAAGQVQALTADEKQVLKEWLDAGAPRL